MTLCTFATYLKTKFVEKKKYAFKSKWIYTLLSWYYAIIPNHKTYLHFKWSFPNLPSYIWYLIFDIWYLIKGILQICSGLKLLFTLKGWMGESDKNKTSLFLILFSPSHYLDFCQLCIFSSNEKIYCVPHTLEEGEGGKTKTSGDVLKKKHHHITRYPNTCVI